LPIFSISFEMPLLRKIAKGIALFIGALFILFVLLYLEEDWRGARDWAACQKELQAKGEILDLRRLAPPGRPEDDLSKVSIFAEIYQQPPPRYEDLIGHLIGQDTPKPTRLDRISVFLGSNDYNNLPKNAHYLDGQGIDLNAWQHFYRTLPQANLSAEIGTPAQDVLHALSQFDPEMNEVEAAVSNPHAYWPLNYDKPWDITLGGITGMLQVARVLPLRAVAHLDNREVDLAKKDYLCSFKLNRPLAQHCLLINYLVMIGVRSIDDAILWEGIHRHAWDNVQLQEMEATLTSTDMLALAAKTLRLERAWSLNTTSLTQAWGPDVKVNVTEYDLSMWYFFHIRPKGWWDQDRCAYSFMVQQQIDAIDPVQGVFNKIPEHDSSHSIMEQVYIPITQAVRYTFANIDHKIAQAETYRRLARVACRLEEYYLTHKQYPQELDELPDLPPHLNQEVLSKQPLHYQRKGDGYLLYSTGWDRKDHGGVRTGPRVEDGAKVANADYDWVWPSP
jgi:hypothetical protein